MQIPILEDVDFLGFLVQTEVLLPDLQEEALRGLGNLAMAIVRDVLNLLFQFIHGLGRDTASTSHIFDDREEGTLRINFLQPQPDLHRVWLHNGQTGENLMQGHVQHPKIYNL